MKPQRFEIGQEVVCVDDKWENDDGEINLEIGPKYGTIVTILAYVRFDEKLNNWFVNISGYGLVYEEIAFEPVMPIEEIMEELEEIHAD